MANQLTTRQRQIFDTIVRWIHQNGYPPTLREIGEHVGIRSPNGVSEHLRALERKGFIRRGEGRARAIQIVAPDDASAPPWVDVRSSAIRRVRYDEVEKTLEVEFHSGRAYAFEGVPPAVHEWLMSVPSKGTYFNQMIKDVYPERALRRPKPDTLRRQLEETLARLRDDD